MINTLYQIVRTIRPRQWLKNMAIFAVPVLSGTFFDENVIKISIMAFISFSIIASATYILNDLVDLPKDRQHPIKKNRPLASGTLSKSVAILCMLFFYLVGNYLAFVHVGTYFGFTILLYILIQLSYSFYFRNVIIMDALFVSTGFIIRVFAGGIASNLSVSSWLILTTIGLSLLLAFGKRRSEKTLLVQHENQVNELKTRETLRHYPDSLLDSVISMSASFCILSYALFSFQTSPIVQNTPINTFLPNILKTPKLMMLTIPLVIYGVARYLYVIYEKKEGESPERVLLSDTPLLITVLLWATTIFGIVYVLPNY